MVLTAKIDLGISSARDYLDRHVAPAQSRFNDLPSKVNALEAANVLWDTVGWIWSDLNPGINERDAERAAKMLSDDRLARCSDLAIVRDLADAKKHGGELGRPTLVVKGISGTGSPGGTAFTISVYGTKESKPVCTLRIDLKDGTSRDMQEVLANVYQFLRVETA
jgi:hypothetical protein